MIKYMKARLNERSTWLALGAAASAGAALDIPWGYIAAAAAFLAALVPDGSVSQ